MPGNTSLKTRSRKAAIEILQQVDLFSPWKYVKNPDLQMLENNSKKGQRRGILDSLMTSVTGTSGGWLKVVSAIVGKKRVSDLVQKYHNERLNRRNNNLTLGKQNGKESADPSKTIVSAVDEEDIDLTFFETSRYIALDVSRSIWFNVFVMAVILANSVIIAFNFEQTSFELGSWYLEMTFIAIYTSEAVLKIFGDPLDYFSSNYNIFDFVMLLLAYIQLIISSHNNQSTIEVLRVFRALRALRALRIISFFRSLQVIVNALITTLVNNLVDFFLFLGLVMFIFGTLAVNFFGEYDPFAWGTLGSSFTTLLTYVTADYWAPFQEILVLNGLRGSEWFSILFLFVGHFLFTNLFIAFITQNIHEATDADLKYQADLREQNILMKKALFMETQPLGNDNSMKSFSNERLEDLLSKLQETVRHDDIFPTHNLCCDLTWIETYLITLNHQENSVYRIQQTHFEIANTLAEWLERRNKMKKGQQ